MSQDASQFDYSSFEVEWENLTEDEKVAFIKECAGLDPEIAIAPTMAGVVSYHFNVRNVARSHLGEIQQQIRELLEDPAEKAPYLKGMKASQSVSAKIYSMIQPGMAFSELSYFIKTLLEIEGKGAHYAFMALYRGIIGPGAMEKIILTLSEDKRLDFVDQYLQSPPEVRMKLGFSFTRILKSIKKRETVIRFYASLFDRHRDADPFLQNINPDLRNQQSIIKKELISPAPEIKIMGLKALAMLTSKIPSDVMAKLMEGQEVKKIRMVLYKVVENSSRGTYVELFDLLLEQMLQSNHSEAFLVFKALVMTGKKQFHELLGIVHEKLPDLLPLIYVEISALTRLSFFTLQDIALNKQVYQEQFFDANMACVFGMIKKRPERVVRILKKYDADSEDSFRMDVTRFIEKTKLLLAKEKQDIETRFDEVVQGVKDASGKSQGLLNKLFSDSGQKKLDQLINGKSDKPIDFAGEIIERVDLSSGKYHSPKVFFSRSMIHNCDFSHSRFVATFLKKAVFYNVDLGHAVFDRACFDFSVFINVDARHAKFINCSFQNASFFNCNLNNTSLVDASFVNCTIYKSSFAMSDLSFSSFAYSDIAAVSFVTSTINQTDFSGVDARFCRFPTGAKTVIRIDEIDFNARKYQLSLKDIPKMGTQLVDEINLLMFCEFIHYGEKKFLKQNQMSLLTAFDIFKAKQADLFQIIPYLLHENIEFPGMGSVKEKTPCGICDYVPDVETISILKKYLTSAEIPVRRNQEHSIEGLFTIGSVGSLAQTSGSDIDYWVCYDRERCKEAQIKLLRKKLESMEKMVADRFELQVTFFLVDIQDARMNDFGDSSDESSGSAQGRLLKEEFYRTMIYVAGKIPLWAVLPTPISLNYYNSILNSISSFDNLSRYIDLGDIHAIPSSEYFGASIWQMFKWLKSPFKSVIKMALLENFIYGYGKESLLCNRYKDEWMNSGVQMRLAQNDSYFILLENLVKHYRDRGDETSVRLLLTCFFLKLAISKDSQIDNTVFGLRKILLEKSMAKWGWSKDEVFHIGSFKSWNYSEIIRLSHTIEKAMVQKYKTVNKAFENLLQGRSKISPEDRTVLGRKIYIEFSKQPGKVEKVLLVSRSDRHLQGLHLKYVQKNSKVGTWTLINRQSKSMEHKEESLVDAHTIEEIGAWLIHNSLYNENTVINLIPNPTYVTFDDIRKLYKAMHEFIDPIWKSQISFEQLLQKSQVVCLFISVNFYAPKQQNKVTEYTAIYLNSWGEMYCKSVYSPRGFASMDDVKKSIMKQVGIDKLPLNTAFYFSKGVSRE